MLSSFDYVKPGANWPPTADRYRQDLAIENTKLYRNELDQVWSDIVIDNRTVKVNWFRRVTEFWQLALFGSAPVFSEPVEIYIDPMLQASRLSQRDLSRYGQAVILSSTMETTTTFTSIPPYRWQPVADPATGTVTGHVLGMPYQTNPEDVNVSPDMIRMIIVDQTGTTTEQRYKYYGQTLGTLEAVTDLPAKHRVYTIDQDVTDDHDPIGTYNAYAHSDYEPIKDLVRQLCIEYALIAKINRHHSDPHLYHDERIELPAVQGSMAIPVPEEGTKPGYILYESATGMVGRFEYIGRLLRDLLSLTGLPDNEFEMTTSGQAVSGSSLAQRTMPMQMRIEDLRRAWERVWQRALTDLTGMPYTDTITWPRPGFPNTLEESTTEQVRIESGTTTAAEARERLDRGTGD